MASPLLPPHHLDRPSSACCSDQYPSAVTSYEWALSVLRQPVPPSVREILHAYSKNGKDDKELLLALLQAKAAEDNRIATQTALHRSLVHLQYDMPLSPSSSPSEPQPSYSYDRPPPSSHHARLTPHLSHPHTYPSPSASSPRTISPPSHALPPIHLPPLKRPRSPPPPPTATSQTSSSSPSSRASPMSLRGLLQEGQEGSLTSPMRASKRPRGTSSVSGHSERADAEMGTVTYHPSETAHHISPRGHRLSHERTTSRGELD